MKKKNYIIINKLIKKFFLLIFIGFDSRFFFKKAKSQNKNIESIFLKKISKFIKNKSFVEIGFHNMEFNCIGLIEKNFSGLLIDSGRIANIFIMKLILYMIGKKNVFVKNIHIEKKNVFSIFV